MCKNNACVEMPFFYIKNVSNEVVNWSWVVVAALFCTVACSDDILACRQCGVPAPIPVNVNILDLNSGFFLWVNPQGKLSSGAADNRDISALFEIEFYNAGDQTRLRIKSLASESSKVVGADFRSDAGPRIVIASFECFSPAHENMKQRLKVIKYQFFFLLLSHR